MHKDTCGKRDTGDGGRECSSTEYSGTAGQTYKTAGISSRRYLGSKYKLLGFIKSTVEAECEGVKTFADIFAGTGAVASAFADKKLITNDILYSNYICHVAWFGTQRYSRKKIVSLVCWYNSLSPEEDNYMSVNFAGTYFSAEDCKKIGFIREDIEQRYHSGEINGRERALLIASLIYAMDRAANTCGHYDSFLRNTPYTRHIELCVLSAPAAPAANKGNRCFNENANELVKRISADVVYIDPPYNSRQYCDLYHLLENVARWEKPPVYGTARKMDRANLKSVYCTQEAASALEDLISNVHARYILLSYNDTGTKTDPRSNARITDEDIMRILSSRGEVKVFTLPYRAYRSGTSAKGSCTERLLLCRCCTSPGVELIQSPLNYTGGKYRLLPQILPHFPEHMDCFVDLFCGGCNVGINVPCRHVLFNDANGHLKDIFEMLMNTDTEDLLHDIWAIIEAYGLSVSSRDGYGKYGCTGSAGLAEYNRERYNRLRRDYNDMASVSCGTSGSVAGTGRCTVSDAVSCSSDSSATYTHTLMLFVLIVYSFNNQMRFNAKGEFNMPVGKRDFNGKMQAKLYAFVRRLKEGDYTFAALDFRAVPKEEWDETVFVYADPPYLISCATYNEQGGWTERDEKDLLACLEELDACGIRFALSNVLQSKGKENAILMEWLARTGYRVVHLASDYSNSNYQTGARGSVCDEVLIMNY